MVSCLDKGAQQTSVPLENRHHTGRSFITAVLNLHRLHAVGYTDPMGIHNTDIRLLTLLSYLSSVYLT